MTGKLKDIIITRTGEQIISFSTRSDFTEAFDELKDVDVDVEIKKHREKRSPDANRYMWYLCGEIAKKLSDETPHTKEDVYRNAIRDIGVWYDDEVEPEKVKWRCAAWQQIGTGWLTERVDFTSDGSKEIIRFYYGSSRYNKKQMSRLIDILVQCAKEQGITTETPEQIEKIKSLWANEPGKE